MRQALFQALEMAIIIIIILEQETTICAFSRLMFSVEGNRQ